MSVIYGTPPTARISGFYAGVAGLIPDSVKVYLVNVPSRPEYPYVVLWGDLGEETSEALADVPNEMHIRFRITYVGLTLDQVAWVVSRVRPALNRVKPYVPGWLPGKLRQSPLADIQADTSIKLEGGAHPLFAVDEFALSADKF